ncbi:hypothetical protein WKV44_09080, partial [Spirochaetia bacterium 38H-sp]
MSVSQKVFLSLLISILIASSVAVLGFFEGFDLVELKFVQPAIEKKAALSALRLDDFLQDRLFAGRDYLDGVFSEPAFRRVFRTVQSEEDIKKRLDLVLELSSAFPELGFVRIVSLDGRRVHFSTNASDIREQSSDRVLFKNFDEIADAALYSFIFSSEDKKPGFFLLPELSSIVLYSFVEDDFGVLQGAAFCYMRLSSLSVLLARASVISPGESLVMLDSGNILIDSVSLLPEERESFLEAVESAGDKIRLKRSSGEVLEGIKVEGKIASYFLLFPDSVLHLSPLLKVLIVLTVFWFCFILLLFLLNLRRDPVTVAVLRLRRFEREIISDLVENRENLNLVRKKKELELRKEEIKKRVLHGLRFKKDVAEDIEKLLDRSWTEVLNILSAIAGDYSYDSSLKKTLEDFMSRLLAEGGLSIKASSMVTALPPESAKKVRHTEEA